MRVVVVSPSASAFRFLSAGQISRTRMLDCRALHNTNFPSATNSRVKTALSNVAADQHSAVLTSEAWQQKARSSFQTDTRPIILFDGVCNLCNAAVNFVLDNDPEGKLRFAALQSDVGKALLRKYGRAFDDISSMVFVDRDGAYIKSEAVLRTAQCLQSPYPSLASLGLLAPLFLRDVIYDNVANNRYSIFGQSTICRTSDSRFHERFVE